MDPVTAAPVDAARLRRLQLVGLASGFTAGAWLGAAEAPTKIVTLGISPVVISPDGGRRVSPAGACPRCSAARARSEPMRARRRTS
jgi:hypothetical protein